VRDGRTQVSEGPMAQVVNDEEEYVAAFGDKRNIRPCSLELISRIISVK
jgi:hypothetical protein